MGEPVDSPTTYGWLVTRYGISPTFDLKKSFLARCEFNLLSNGGESPKGYFSRALDKVVFFRFIFRETQPSQEAIDKGIEAFESRGISLDKFRPVPQAPEVDCRDYQPFPEDYVGLGCAEDRK